MQNVKLTALLTILFLLLPFTEGIADPGRGLYYVTGNEVNVRSGPGQSYSVVGKRHKGDIVTVYNFYDSQWAKMRLGSSFAYIHRSYIAYKGPIPDDNHVTPSSSPGVSSRKSSNISSSGGRGFWATMWEITKALLWLSAILLIIGGSSGSEWVSAVGLFQACCGIGAIVGWLLFHNGHAGASVGAIIWLLLVLGFVFSVLDWDLISINGIGNLLWRVVAAPFFILNYLQFFLSKPWRPWLKHVYLDDATKEWLRPVLSCLKIPLYIVLTPLRFVNAVYYNMVIHLLYELSNYMLEVFAPSDTREGKGDVGKWLLWLPVRVLKYPVFHFGITVIESVIWTVTDTLIPALTLFHGTDRKAVDSMLCEPNRNKYRQGASGWRSGTWTVGAGNYAGDGIYFGISRKTLSNYQSGAAIAARVSMGRTINVPLMPAAVYETAGKSNAHAVSKWGLQNGYTSGEWWRDGCDWWEICLYDAKNRYNYSWRIRPIYAVNYNSGIMQRIPGGTSHWLFRKVVLQDIWESIRELFKF